MCFHGILPWGSAAWGTICVPWNTYLVFHGGVPWKIVSHSAKPSWLYGTPPWNTYFVATIEIQPGLITARHR